MSAHAEGNCLQVICKKNRKKGSCVAARLAEAEQLEVMGGYTEPARAPEPAVQGLEHLLLEPAPLDVLDLTAALADQMMVVTSVDLGELEALGAPGLVGEADQPEVHQESQRPVHRDEIDTSLPQPAVDVGDREGRPALDQHIDDGPPGCGESQSLAREDVGDRPSVGDG
jgi:hypothetical protein